MPSGGHTTGRISLGENLGPVETQDHLLSSCAKTEPIRLMKRYGTVVVAEDLSTTSAPTLAR